MKSAFGLSIPQTLEEICEPQRIALLVYDMQVGILSQIKNADQITQQVLKVLRAAREARSARVLFAASFIAKRTHGRVSAPHGDGMATSELT